MTIVNARARFGLEDGRIFDYATSKSYDAVGYLDTPEGRWDLPLVAECLKNGWFIEAALVPASAVEVDDKVAQANRDFLQELKEDIANQDPAGPIMLHPDTAQKILTALGAAPETPTELAQPEEEAKGPPAT